MNFMLQTRSTVFSTRRIEHLKVQVLISVPNLQRVTYQTIGVVDGIGTIKN